MDENNNDSTQEEKFAKMNSELDKYWTQKLRDADVELVMKKFISAADGKPPTDEQRRKVDLINEHVRKLAKLIALELGPSNNRFIALTSLEDVQMRAVRAVFSQD